MTIKPIRKPTRKPTTPTTSSTPSTKTPSTNIVKTTETAVSRPPAPKRMATRRPVPPIKKEEPVVEPPKAEEPKQPATPPGAQPRIPRRRTVVPPVAKPKDVEAHVQTETQEPEARSSRPEGESQEASKPVNTSGRQSNEAEPGPAYTRPTDEQQVSMEAMKRMTLEERYRLFRSMNKNPEVFMPLRKELPKKEYMRKNEAVIRGLIEERSPRAPGLTVYYCPYCYDWQPFHYHAWTGYTKCCGCTMSTKDMYTGVDNGIYGKGD